MVISKMAYSLKFTCQFWTSPWRDFRVPVEISLTYWRYKAMNFSFHYSNKYFKNNNCFPSILNFFFLLMRLFRKDFQRNVQHSIHMSDITKRNSNVYFILGNTGHAWRELTVIADSLRTILPYHNTMADRFSLQKIKLPYTAARILHTQNCYSSDKFCFHLKYKWKQISWRSWCKRVTQYFDHRVQLNNSSEYAKLLVM